MSEEKQVSAVGKTDRGSSNHDLFRIFQSETVWMAFGCSIGYLTPVSNYFGVDIKISGFVIFSVMVIEMLVVAKLLRLAFYDIPEGGWSIKKMIASSNAYGINKRSRIYGYISSVMTSKIMIFGGFLFGQVLAIYFGSK